jgi:hypothetical protein
MNIPGRRPVGRHDGKLNRCVSCGARLMVGEPSTTSTWPQSLTLTEEQMADLYAAAAEYRDLTAEAGEYERVIEYLDWAFVDVRKRRAA